jgi:hypothetical protein
MTPEAAETLGRASRVDLCTCVVVGIRANGGGLYVNWSGKTPQSLVMHLEAAKLLAVQSWIEATEIDHSKQEAAE